MFLQQVLQLRHQNEVLENEIDLLKKQITFRDEFIEVRQAKNLISFRIEVLLPSGFIRCIYRVGVTAELCPLDGVL